ncbi:winged helix-turn-helix domain-containing protein [Rubripirellula amarantea]|nr:winged helix-turn-helix domain-containing protein [Rubripirellula amarantea]
MVRRQRLPRKRTTPNYGKRKHGYEENHPRNEDHRPQNASAKKPATKKPASKTPAKKADKKMSQIDAALAVLKKARKPLSCKEVVEAMGKQKLWTSPGGKTPDATLYAAILRDIKKGADARFKKAAPGRFTKA